MRPQGPALVNRRENEFPQAPLGDCPGYGEQRSMRQFATIRALICWPGAETVKPSQRDHLAPLATIERPQYDISQVS